jgi:hypothetical protein
MDLSDRQKAAASRRLGLSRSLNRAMATNATRRGFAARSEAAASAGSGLSDALFSQRLSSTQDLAAAQAGHEAADAQRKAQKKASLIGTIGTIAGAALMMMSSEKVKDDHGHEEGLLSKLKKVRVNRWNYKGENKTHVGPFAEEFNKEFGIDTDRTDMINVIDALGVTLGAVKELDKKVEARG